MNIPLPAHLQTIGSTREVFRTAAVAELDDLTGGRGILILAPHPDDESLGCGGLIALASARDIPVIVAVMTDGSGSHPQSQSHPAHVLAQLREKEIAQALEKLGQPSATLVFFGFTDGKMDQQMARHGQAANCLADIVRDNNIGAVFAAWEEDPHPDHKATFGIARNVAAACPEVRLFAYPIWGLTQPDEMLLSAPLGHVYRLNISDMRDLKREAIGQHRSQLGEIINDDPAGFVLQPDVLELFNGRFEIFIEWRGDATVAPSAIKLRSVDPRHFDTLYARTLDPWSYVGGDYETHRYDTIMDHLPPGRFRRGFELGCSIGVLTERLAGRCDFLLGADCSLAAVQAARTRTRSAGNVTIEQMLAPAQMPEGKFDLIVFSEVLYFFSDADLQEVAAFLDERLEEGGTCMLVNYLGDTESPRTGENAAESFMQILSQRFVAKHHHRETLFRLDVLARNTGAGR